VAAPSSCSGTTTPTPTPTPPQGLPWYDCSWDYRKNITIDHTKVSGTLAGFPVLISLASDADLQAHALASGNDILFTDSGGLKLPHEIESYSAGTLVAWVKVPSVSSAANTTIVMYYGNSGASSQQNPTSVWDNNYKAVWHLKETAGGAGAIKDSTENVNHGTDSGSPTLGAAGKIGKAIDFDGTNDVIKIDNSNGAGHVLDYTSGPFTISAWFYARATNRHIAGKRDGGSDQYQFGIGGNPNLLFTGNDTNNQGLGGTVLSLSTWYYGDVVVNSSGYPELYLNGVKETWSDWLLTRPYPFAHRAVDFSIGARWNVAPVTAANFNGLIDEVRVSNTARSAQWVATEYANQNSPSTFSIVGSEEGSTCGGMTTFSTCAWGYRKKITVDKAKVVGSQTDFPVLVSLASDSDLSAHAQADGDDIVFTSSDGTTQLAHEIESYTSTSGALTAWVKVPSISSAANTDIYLYYGNPSSTNQQNPAGVWDSNYVGVWHMKESGAGTQGEYRDSTSYANHGQGGDGNSLYVPDQIAGRVGYAQNFSNVNGKFDFIDAGQNSVLDISGNQITMEAWVQHEVTSNPPAGHSSQPYYGILNHKGWNNGYRIALEGDQFSCPTSSPFCLNFQLPGASYDLHTNAVLTVNTWYHVVGTYNGSWMAVFINGQADANLMAKSDAILPSNVGEKDVWIGQGDMPQDVAWSSEWVGKLDEVRISKIGRTDSWIATEYNNENSPATFYSVGSEEASPCGTPTPTPTPPAWDPCNWGYRKKITIDKAKVTGSQSDFPVLVSLASDTDLHNHARPDGYDIVFTTSDGTTRIPHEIESYTSGTGALVAWVKVPGISSAANTDIYLYYGSPSASNMQNPTGVWDANYAAVWHLGETPNDGTAGGHADSTANNNDGTPMNFQDGGGGTTNTAGKIDGADFFAGDDDYITVPSPVNSDPTTQLTLSAWIRDDVYGDVVSRGDSYVLRLWNTGQLLFSKYQGAGTWFNMAPGGVNLKDGALHHIVGGQNATGMFMYIDGVQVDGNSDTTAIVYGLGPTIEIGRHGNGNPGYNFTGKIDEVRISRTGRSGSWITTEYKNQNSPSTFYSVGSEEISPCGGTPTPTPTPTPNPPWYPNCGWPYRKNITLNKTMVNTDQTDFTVLINLASDNDLKNHAKSDGSDLLFTTDDGQTAIPYERESYDSATGALTAWVKVPSLNSKNDADNTTIYLYYGYPSSPEMAHPSMAWDGSFSGVWHLTNNFLDSTAAGNTSVNSATTDVAGKIGRGRSFSGAGQYLTAPDTELNTATGFTITAWFKAGVTTFARHLIWEGNVTGDGWGEWSRACETEMDISLGNFVNPTSTDNRLTFFLGDADSGRDANTLQVAVPFSDTTNWHYVAANATIASSPTRATLFLNGTQVGTDTGTRARAFHFNWTTLRFGKPGDNSRYFNGQLDEIHVSTTARSPDWIRTEYNNQNNPSLFHKVGAEESFICGGSSSPAYVQSTSQSFGATNSAAITLPGSSTTGDLLVLSFVYDSPALSPTSVTDSKGNTYTSAVGPTNVGGWGEAYTYYAKNIAGGAGAITATVTLNGATTSLFDVYLLEYSGVDTAAPLDQTSSGTGSGTAMDSGSKTTTKAPELIYGFGADDNNCNADSPYTNRETANGQCAMDQTVYSTGPYHVTATQNPTGQWLLQMATFKGA
jgi:hypothetical protein